MAIYLFLVKQTAFAYEQMESSVWRVRNAHTCDVPISKKNGAIERSITSWKSDTDLLCLRKSRPRDQKPVFIVFRYMDGSKAGWWAIVNAKEGRITVDELHSRLEYPGCYGRHYCAFDHEVDLDDVHFEANGIIYQVPDTHRRYGKLVRDKVPNAIAECGDIPIARTLTPEEYKAALQEKLCEEAEEFWESYSLEKVADILEVVRAMTHCFTKYQFSDALEAMQKKAEGRGCFARRTFLEDVVGEDANWFYEVGSIIAREFEDSSFVSYLQKDKDVEPKKSIAWQMVHDKKARLGRQSGFSSQASFCTPQGMRFPWRTQVISCR